MLKLTRDSSFVTAGFYPASKYLFPVTGHSCLSSFDKTYLSCARIFLSCDMLFRFCNMQFHWPVSGTSVPRGVIPTLEHEFMFVGWPLLSRDRLFLPVIGYSCPVTGYFCPVTGYFCPVTEYSCPVTGHSLLFLWQAIPVLCYLIL
jgi:hypothetical protein